MKDEKFICLLCRSFYGSCRELGIVFYVGERCNNQSYQPPSCNQKTPCPGRLRLIEPSDYKPKKETPLEDLLSPDDIYQ